LPEGHSTARRSRITNGSALFGPEGNETSAWSRRFTDILALRLHDLGPYESLSESQVSLARRATTIEVELERLETALSAGEDVDMDLYQRLVNTLGRQLERLGLKRVPREIGPTDLHAYLAAKRAAEGQP
jgi:hypothetical protein